MGILCNFAPQIPGGGAPQDAIIAVAHCCIKMIYASIAQSVRASDC